MQVSRNSDTMAGMHPVEALTQFGGAASRAKLLRLTDRVDLERVVASGDVVRDGHGRYSLPTADEAIRVANRLTGVVSHLSAAAYWGWELKTMPERPHVTFARNRNVSAIQRKLAVPHWAALVPDDLHDDIVTTKRRTLVDCIAAFPLDEALAIADSALRAEDITNDALGRLADDTRGPGSVQARRVAACARGEAANPFESVLRAISLDIEGLHLTPQLRISAPGFYARPDLVDPDLMLVVEADSHTWHSSRASLRRDCRRYNALTVLGWLVARFTWEDVMFEPDLVRRSLRAYVEVATQRADLLRRHHLAA